MKNCKVKRVCIKFDALLETLLEARIIRTLRAKSYQYWFGLVVWSETVGLRTRPVWDQKIGLGLGLTRCGLVLVLQVWSRVVKHSLVTIDVIMILKDTATFQVLFIVSLFCASNITTVGIKVAFTYLNVKFVKCLCSLPVVLVLLFWSWSRSCKQRSWSWSWSLHRWFGFLQVIQNIKKWKFVWDTAKICCNIIIKWALTILVHFTVFFLKFFFQQSTLSASTCVW